ncbi:MAG: hypothetical protein WCK58_16800, partial [Chloroflexota bacterium]
HCTDTACTGATTSTIDSAGNVGSYTSVAIGADGLGLVSYYDTTNGDLKVAHCTDTACTGATTSTIDSAGDVGQYTSITVDDVLVRALISYYDTTNGDLKVAVCGDTACTSAAYWTPFDSAGDVGQYTSITMGADGLGLVSYLDYTNSAVKVARCMDYFCNSATKSTIASAWTPGDTSITIGADGLVLVAYNFYQSHSLKVTHCWKSDCSNGATTSTIDSAGHVGQYTSITLGADGLGLVSYYDVTNGDLKVAHLSSAAGTPYVRRR